MVENAAIESARTMGQGDRHLSDQVATEAMRKTMDTVPMHGTIVIGEGERDDAPMLYIGEQVGGTVQRRAGSSRMSISPSIRSKAPTCAQPVRPARITVLAASEKGGLLHAPDCYMEKIVVGPSCKNAVELDAPVAVNLKNIARRLHRGVEDLVVMVLDRPRHEKLISDIRKAGARIKLIGDGDLSAGIAAAVIGTGVHAVMGSGGAPEGVITAAAIRCLNGYMQGRLVIDKPELEERIAQDGDQRQKENLRSRRPRSRQTTDLRRHRRDRRRAAKRRPLLRRRHSHLVDHPDFEDGTGPLRRQHPPG